MASVAYLALTLVLAVLSLTSATRDDPFEMGADLNVTLMGGAGRRLLCNTPDCVINNPLTCLPYDLSCKCYFTPAMLRLPSTVTGYYCGLGCPATVQTYSGAGYRVKVQQKCPTIACASTIGQVISTGANGCASSSGYVTGLASGQTKALYYNADSSWITDQFKSFCATPSVGQLTAVAGMLAQGLATAQAKAQISGVLHVCGCCDGSESASQSIGVYTTATANAIVQAVAQAITDVFGQASPSTSSDCYSGAILAESVGFASALSQSLVDVTNEWYKQLSLSRTGNPSYFNQVCKSADIPWLDTLKVRYANAYACAITTVLSSAYDDDSTVSGLNVHNSTDTSIVCADNYDVAWSTNWVAGTSPATCKGSCLCPGGFVNGAGCPPGVQVCQGGTCVN